jgi:hypothetical protein
MGLNYAVNDNQFGWLYTSFIDLIQNITQYPDRKTDGCDARIRGICETMRAKAELNSI